MPKDKTNRNTVAVGGRLIAVTDDENARAVRAVFMNMNDGDDFRELCEMLNLSIEEAAKFDLARFRTDAADHVRDLIHRDADIADAS